MIKAPLINKKHFRGLDECTWLFSGAETPPHEGCIDAVNQYMVNRGKGPIGRELNDEVEQSLRRNLSTLLNAKPENIALVSNASEAISLIVQSMDLKEGDNVVLNTLEFPSGVFPLLLLQDKGVEVRKVEHTDWNIEVDDIMKLVDDRTKLVLTSHVSFSSGTRIAYKQLYERLKTTDALLLLDATQSLGAFPVDLQYADFIVSSSYKWLMSVHGLGIIALNPARTSHIVPASAGWRSVTGLFYPERFKTFERYEDARKFELGYPSFPSIYVMNYSTSLLLEIGIDKIEQHILALGEELIERLNAAGYKVMTPIEKEKRAGNISFECEKGEEIADRLLKKNIYVWGGDGRVRASIHLFNDLKDIETFITSLENAQSELIS